MKLDTPKTKPNFPPPKIHFLISPFGENFANKKPLLLSGEGT